MGSTRDVKRIETPPVGTKIFGSDPEIITIEHALYVPRTTELHDPFYGLFSPYGRLIEAGAYFRDPDSKLVDANPVSHVDPIGGHPSADPAYDYVYIGNLGIHFGHFLTGTLCRFWCDQKLYRNARIVFHSGHSIDKLMSRSWFRFFIEALEIERHQLTTFDRPTILERIIVPSPAFGENHFAHQAYHRLTTRIAARARREHNFGDKIYLSKTALDTGVWKFHGEHVIEATMRLAGFDIIHPQHLTLDQQLCLFDKNRMVTGIVGSAFHNSVFTTQGRGVALSHMDSYSSNFHLMDALSAAEIDYYHMECSSEGTTVPPGFHAATAIGKPERVAEQLVELARYGGCPPALLSAPERQARQCSVTSHHNTTLSVDMSNGLLTCAAKASRRARPCVATSDGHSVWLAHPERDRPIGINGIMEQLSILNFELQPYGHERVRLWQPRYRRYLTAEPDGTISCNRTAADLWETFQIANCSSQGV